MPGVNLPENFRDAPRRSRRNFRLTSACVTLAALAVLLDGFAPPSLAFATNLRWIDGAAVLCLALGVDWRALLAGDDEGTPIDGLLLGALAIGAVQAWATSGRDGSAEWLAQLAAGSGVYFGLTRAMRRAPAAIEWVWRALAGVAMVLGAHAIWAATGGLGGLTRQELLVDAGWSGRHTLVKGLGFLFIALAGRALESRAAPWWRVATLFAFAGAGLHLATGGIGLGARALARLDDPRCFSTLSVTLLLAVAIAREAWSLGRLRKHEMGRWRALAVATGVVAVGGVLGEASGGEGVRMLVALGALAVMSVRAPEAAVVTAFPAEVEVAEEPEEQARAA